MCVCVVCVCVCLLSKIYYMIVKSYSKIIIQIIQICGCHWLQASEALAGEFKAVLALISQDEILAQSFPAVRASALSYLEKIDAEGFNTYTEARYVCLSLENTCAFLLDMDEMVSDLQWLVW